MLLGYRFETYGEGSELCRLSSGGTRLTPRSDAASFTRGSYFRMDGPGVFRLTARKFPGFSPRLMEHSALHLHELDSDPHQASAGALAHLEEELGTRPARSLRTFQDVGNQVATSIPNALHYARTKGHASRGTRSLLVGSSAGIRWCGDRTVSAGEVLGSAATGNRGDRWMGQALCAALRLQGRTVRRPGAAARSDAACKPWMRIACGRPCRADFPELTQGADTVFHLAALSKPWGREQDFEAINFHATERLLAARAAAGAGPSSTPRHPRSSRPGGTG